MKISQLMVAVAVAGLLGMSARASLPNGYCSAKLKLTILVQNDSELTGDNWKYSTSKIKFVTKDMLDLIGDEFDTTIPDGAQLVMIDNFWNGVFAVLTKQGSVLLNNVSSNGDSDWELYTEYSNYVYKGKYNNPTGKYSYNYIMIGDLYWQDNNSDSWFEIYGQGSIKDSYKSPNYKHSYKLTGADNGYLDIGDVSDSVVVSGTISGAGKDEQGM